MFDKKFYPHLWLLVFYIPFVLIIKDFLPPEIARENGPIENFQLVLVTLGVYLCWQAFKKCRKSLDRYIWQAGMLFYLLLFGRELSWGRALFMHANGEMAEWCEMGLYGKLVHPLIGVAIACLLLLFYKGKFLSFLKARKMPMWDLIFLFIFIILVDISEHWNLSIFHGEIDEELFECAMYFQMLQVTNYIGKQTMLYTKVA